MMGLTRRQKDCLDTLKAFHKRRGRMPSCDELGALLGITAKSTVSRLLLRLEQRGHIKRIHGSPQAIVIRKPKCPHCGKELRASR